MNEKKDMEKRISSEWQPLGKEYFDALNKIAEQIHKTVPERPEIFTEKIELFPDGCRGLFFDNRLVGYGISHLWNLNSIPPLNDFLGYLPENPTCIYIHDVAVLPEMRGHKAADRFMDYIMQLAKKLSINSLALVSLYGTDIFWSRFGFKIYSNNDIESKLKTYGETAKYMICKVSG
ncbi:MAG: GNAT family N-acetyltransferase [Chitinispirillales bacterium]|nr:GNAT family N-acetyltransferase [Chitinispirillales bacterium]